MTRDYSAFFFVLIVFMFMIGGGLIIIESELTKIRKLLEKIAKNGSQSGGG